MTETGCSSSYIYVIIISKSSALLYAKLYGGDDGVRKVLEGSTSRLGFVIGALLGSLTDSTASTASMSLPVVSKEDVIYTLRGKAATIAVLTNQSNQSTSTSHHSNKASLPTRLAPCYIALIALFPLI